MAMVNSTTHADRKVVWYLFIWDAALENTSYPDRL